MAISAMLPFKKRGSRLWLPSMIWEGVGREVADRFTFGLELTVDEQFVGAGHLAEANRANGWCRQWCRDVCFDNLFAKVRIRILIP